MTTAAGQAIGTVRVRTVVYGLVMMVVAASVLLKELFGVGVNVPAVGLVLLTGSGAALVAAGITSAVRDARRSAQQHP